MLLRNLSHSPEHAKQKSRFIVRSSPVHAVVLCNPKPMHFLPRVDASAKRPGFTLVMTLSLLALLVLVAVGMLSLSSITLRGGSQANAMAQARANARMALMLAIGDLQKHCGKDRAITARASVTGETIAHPEWTGVWDSGTATGEATTWLVSGAQGSNRPLPNTPITGTKATLVPSFESRPAVEVPSVAVNSGTNPSRLAWWTADQGTKAMIDWETPRPQMQDRERMGRSSIALDSGVAALDDEWSDASNKFNDNNFLTLDTAALAANQETLATKYFHDLTTGGYGLPVNVVDGGMKKDLSVLFDTTNTAHSTYMLRYFGASPQTASQKYGSTVYQFAQPTGANGKKFFLIDELSNNGSRTAGPNWGILYNYYQLCRNSNFSKASLSSPSPDLYSDIRLRNWAPYTANKMSVGSETFHDTQHVTNSLRPTLSLMQMGFRLKAKAVTAVAGVPTYRLVLELKPVVGLWNPHAIALPAESYSFEWGLFSYLRLKITTPDGRVRTPRLWMRELWNAGNTRDGIPDQWMRMIANNIDFEPGEFRMFSVASSATIAADNQLTPGWSSEGAFTMDAKYNGTGGSPASGFMDLPVGSTVQLEELCIEDRQNQETQVRWAGLQDKYSTTWFTLKMSGFAINRFQDFWTSGKSSNWEMPERVKPTSSASLSVEQLASVREHLATFSLRLRTATEARQEQSLRGWHDCNPRAYSMNPRWDGSKGSSNALEGWWFSSPFFTPASIQLPHGDGGPDGRGLIAVGSVGNETPQADFTSGRYRGYGGASSSPAGGQTHVPIFDVPRTALLSLAQFQHAEISRYNYESAFPVGNSYANPRLPANKTSLSNYNSIGGFTLVDQSYLLNQKLWDSWFFSSLSSLHKGSTQAVDQVYPLQSIAWGKTSLPHPRMIFMPQPGDVRISNIMSRDSNIAAEAVASRIGIAGAFNVNSTSVNAWKTVLASMTKNEMPTLKKSGALQWDTSDLASFSHFQLLHEPGGYSSNTPPQSRATWMSNRILSDKEIDALATAIVVQVRARGPFRSLADFVNRTPSSSDVTLQRKGALQAALDATINASLPETLSKKASPTAGSLLQQTLTDAATDQQVAGHSCHVSQADVLQAIGPLIQVRSDSFLIRTMGESLSPDGKTVLARAYCEARIQRVASYLDEQDRPETATSTLKSNTNKTFGRRFKITAFRWLNPQDVL